MPKILLIEDEAMLRGEVADWLTFEGYEVLTAADGVDGANAALLHLPDLIICDIMMPRLDGYGVMLDVRAHPLTQFTPFIFTTCAGLIAHPFENNLLFWNRSSSEVCSDVQRSIYSKHLPV